MTELIKSVLGVKIGCVSMRSCYERRFTEDLPMNLADLFRILNRINAEGNQSRRCSICGIRVIKDYFIYPQTCNKDFCKKLALKVHELVQYVSLYPNECRELVYIEAYREVVKELDNRNWMYFICEGLL